uniref:RNA helicase n=1 Tax=Myripristis murdjan TaxID=586833 RepID=A0A667Y4P6_9TELE
MQKWADKHGVTVTSDPEAKEGTIALTVYKHGQKVARLYVKNTGAETVYITQYNIVDQDHCFTLKDDHGIKQKKRVLLGPGGCEIQVHFRAGQAGVYQGELKFHFTTLSETFTIVRNLEVNYQTSLGKALAPKSPYRRYSTAFKATRNEIVRGKPPARKSGTQPKTEVPLGHYLLPSQELQYFLCGWNGRVLRGVLNWKRYSKFHLLLHVEELQMRKDIKKYNMADVSMVKDKNGSNHLILQVPGVSENRPSVLPGDSVLVTPQDQSGYLADSTYEGYVHHVDRDHVYLDFKNLLVHFTEDMKFSVEFNINRLTLRIQHRAVDLASACKLKKVLFPDTANSPSEKLQELRLFNEHLKGNEEQCKAVQHIVAGSSKPAPYLVFGPPGTGKTVTVVEAVKQVQRSQASCHILVCAPTNAAVDLLCESIARYSSRDEFLCNMKQGELVVPYKEELMKYKIVVTTLITASRLVTLGIPEGHYTHIFVDEAGHAKETECIIPLAGLLDPKTGQVVLVGDPKQLGPIISSSLVKKYGMGSLLDRLMKDFEIYKKNEHFKYNNHFITKLRKNYRSHPDILKIPNELFYDGELEPCADKETISFDWEGLPNKVPLIFHGVVGCDEREETSPSYFNTAEVDMLMKYLKDILDYLKNKRGVTAIKPQQIGIIAPYRKQVQKIRYAIGLEKKDIKMEGLENIKVGSVEDFQGEESEVILVSTVRSDAKYIKEDQKFNLGFVYNEKRFNVAITRAQALLIVVGNPRFLRRDKVWNKFIEYCRENGSYSGIGAQDDEGLNLDHHLIK